MNTSLGVSSTSRLDTIAYAVLLLTVFLVPFFFIPSLVVPFGLSKSALVLYGTAISLVLWMIARLKDGVFEMPKNWLYASSLLVAVTYLLSALFSDNPDLSLSGSSFEFGTASFIVASFVLFALVPILVRTKERLFMSYVALLGSFVVVGLFHLIRFIFGPETLSFGMFTDPSSNLLGKWNDLSIFLGLVSLSSLLSLEYGTLGRPTRILSYVAFVGSIVLLVITNFQPVWIVLALLSLVLFVYQLSFKRREAGRTLPMHTLAVLVISTFFVITGGSIGSSISSALGISQVEVRPSWSATSDVTSSSLASNPVFGVGPNRFSTEWLRSKPAGINDTVFWNVDFNYGIGFVPSLLVTTGIVGSVAFILFLALFIMTALRALIRDGANPFSRYLVLLTLFGSLYLWVFAVIYVPSHAIWILTLALSGLFIASLREDGMISFARISISGRPAWSFVSVLVTILALIGTLSFGYFVSKTIYARVAFERGIFALSSSNSLDDGERFIASAISVDEKPLYYRILSELYLARLNQLFADNTVSESEAQTRFQSLLGTAIQASQRAVALDSTDYQNHLSLGRVFEAVVPLNISGAYDNAVSAYKKALEANPESPEIHLILARLEVANKDNDSARKHIDEALAKKRDYAEAIFLLSQIEIADGNIAKAIESVRSVAVLSPNDPGVFFQLGLLYYNQREYDDAVASLERAIALSPNYANAQYFLGLSYYQNGDRPRAIAQFESLSKSNPDNAEVTAILDNLKAGKTPFANQPDNRPERRSTLPVRESSVGE